MQRSGINTRNRTGIRLDQRLHPCCPERVEQPVEVCDEEELGAIVGLGLHYNFSCGDCFTAGCDVCDQPQFGPPAAPWRFRIIFDRPMNQNSLIWIPGDGASSNLYLFNPGSPGTPLALPSFLIWNYDSTQVEFPGIGAPGTNPTQNLLIKANGIRTSDGCCPLDLTEDFVFCVEPTSCS